MRKNINLNKLVETGFTSEEEAIIKEDFVDFLTSALTPYVNGVSNSFPDRNAAITWIVNYSGCEAGCADKLYGNLTIDPSFKSTLSKSDIVLGSKGFVPNKVLTEQREKNLSFAGRYQQ